MNIKGEKPTFTTKFTFSPMIYNQLCNERSSKRFRHDLTGHLY